MNQDTVQGHWHEIKGKLKQQWGNLTDDDIARANGTREELSGLIQKKYGYQRERVEEEIDRFLDDNGWNR